MRVLVIGAGGREHALVQTFHRQGHTVFCFPGNPGTQQLCAPSPPVDVNDFEALVHFVQEQKIELTVVGPEEYLDRGIANFFIEYWLLVFGPMKEAARLESSKAWAKRFMKRYGIPTARYAICCDIEEAVDALEQFSCGVVIKQNGLAGGKGVVCCANRQEAEEQLKRVYDAKHDAIVVVEEMLSGPEVSLLAFCDGNTMVPMLPSQDHKRLLDGDFGPNTGGMGAYAPVPFVTEEVMKEIQSTILDPTLKGLKKEYEYSYTGVIYFGLMLTPEGPKLLEYNCRFGDPEAQAILPLLESDLAEIMMACQKGKLNECTIKWKQQHACCVVMASPGYPEKPIVGTAISSLDAFPEGTTVFHAGTKHQDNGEIVSSGGRVLGVTGVGNTLEDAVRKAYGGVRAIDFPGGHFRTDIASQSVAQEEKKRCC